MGAAKSAQPHTKTLVKQRYFPLLLSHIAVWRKHVLLLSFLKRGPLCWLKASLSSVFLSPDVNVAFQQAAHKVLLDDDNLLPLLHLTIDYQKDGKGLLPWLPERQRKSVTTTTRMIVKQKQKSQHFSSRTSRILLLNSINAALFLPASRLGFETVCVFMFQRGQEAERVPPHPRRRRPARLLPQAGPLWVWPTGSSGPFTSCSPLLSWRSQYPVHSLMLQEPVI